MTIILDKLRRLALTWENYKQDFEYIITINK